MWPARAAPAQHCAPPLSASWSGPCLLGGTKMQDLGQLGGPLGHGQPWSPLKGAAAELSLLEFPRTLSHGRLEGPAFQWDQLLLDGQAWLTVPSAGTSACPGSCLGPGEHSGAWGEFEGFHESSAKSEQFSQGLGLTEGSAAHPLPGAASDQEERGPCQPRQGRADRTDNAAVTLCEPILCYEKIFKFAFQEVVVQPAPDSISALSRCLEVSCEAAAGLGPAREPLSLESRKLWSALQKPPDSPAPQGLWEGSHSQEQLFLVLGIDAAQKSLSQSGVPSLEGPAITEPADALGSSPWWNPCSGLIQTQFLGSPSSRQRGLMKNPFPGHTQYLTTLRKKKLLTPHGLLRTLFKGDVC